ncbi:Uu.00g121200.m01.CDS01 [Anthostomella pinea]|uniref:Uu.00g121200.m01.CDS01 n=1 Tax=Anthostomella pinea TaxID=933095 RepID=A0AAI8YHB1_9PEZI|nr:Uu.00g121200.m01.CDS01 [Anthostomella pinea]
MPPLHFLLLLLGVFASYAAASSAPVLIAAPTYCKCTCFKNSTLIQLGPQTSPGSTPGTTTTSTETFTNSKKIQQVEQQQHGLRSPDPDLGPDSGLDTRAASSSCTQCTRAFCLSLALPICKEAEETDVVATCFQRDSRKDQIIVWGFILGTAGLLGWAAAKRVIEMRAGKKAAAALGLPHSGPGGGGGIPARDRGAYIPVAGERGG